MGNAKSRRVSDFDRDLSMPSVPPTKKQILFTEHRQKREKEAKQSRNVTPPVDESTGRDRWIWDLDAGPVRLPGPPTKIQIILAEWHRKNEEARKQSGNVRAPVDAMPRVYRIERDKSPGPPTRIQIILAEWHRKNEEARKQSGNVMAPVDAMPRVSDFQRSPFNPSRPSTSNAVGGKKKKNGSG